VDGIGFLYRFENVAGGERTEILNMYKDTNSASLNSLAFDPDFEKGYPFGYVYYVGTQPINYPTSPFPNTGMDWSNRPADWGDEKCYVLPEKNNLYTLGIDANKVSLPMISAEIGIPWDELLTLTSPRLTPAPVATGCKLRNLSGSGTSYLQP
jgi:hypothetical protein